MARARPLPLLLLALAAACGQERERSLAERLDDQPGFWFEARPRDPALEARRRELAALGYTAGVEDAPAESGVVVLDPTRAEAGLNLYSSGHAPEAFLMDMQGEVLHRWALDYDAVRAFEPAAPPMDHPSQAAWRRVRLCPDGALLALYEGLALVKVDRDSRLAWVFPGRAHHDLELLPDGRIVTLARRARLVDGLNASVPLVEESLVVLSPEGAPLEELSLVEALRRSAWADRLVEAARGGEGVQRLTIGGLEALDVLHANSVQVLDGAHVDLHPAFAAGNVLTCFRELNVLAVVDRARGRVAWLRDGDWIAPHDPRLLPSGSLLLFDNLGNGGYSQVLELDPLTGAERWAWRGAPPEAFLSIFCGTARRLAGGDTLITESTAGRALEVAPDGTIVWAFLSPHRAGERGELVAALFQVERLPLDAAGWLGR